MLKTRIIPTLLTRGRNLVKGEKFDSWRVVGNTLQAARVHNMRQVDELCILNVSGEPWDLDDVQALCESTFMPVTIGGGVSSLEDFRDLLAAGADKVCIRDFALIAPAASKFGSQSVVVCINQKEQTPDESVEEAKCAQALGAGEIILQSVDRDGTMQGYDLDLIREVCNAVRIPVIVSSGCSGYSNMAEAIDAGASAVAAGALFIFCDATPQGAARWLHAHGYHTRCEEVA